MPYTLPFELTQQPKFDYVPPTMTLANQVRVNPVQQQVAAEVKQAAANPVTGKKSLVDILSGGLNVVGQLLGQRNYPAPTYADPYYPYYPVEEKKDNTIWIVLAAVVVIVVVLIIFLNKGKGGSK